VLPQPGLSDQDASEAPRPAATLDSEVVTEVLYGLDADKRERVAALSAEGRSFWLDVSLRETSPDDLADADQPKRSHQPSHSLAGSARKDLPIRA
jgi:hypothetical protein